MCTRAAYAEAGEAELGKALAPLLEHWVVTFGVLLLATLLLCAVLTYLCAWLWRRFVRRPLSRFGIVLLGTALTALTLAAGWPLLVLLAIGIAGVFWHH